MDNSNSIIPSQRVIIDAVYVEEDQLNGINQLPPPPNTPQFSVTLSPKSNEKDFVFLISCFAAVGLGGLVGLIIVVILNIF